MKRILLLCAITPFALRAGELNPPQSLQTQTPSLQTLDPTEDKRSAFQKAIVEGHYEWTFDESALAEAIEADADVSYSGNLRRVSAQGLRYPTGEIEHIGFDSVTHTLSYGRSVLEMRLVDPKGASHELSNPMNWAVLTDDSGSRPLSRSPYFLAGEEGRTGWLSETALPSLASGWKMEFTVIKGPGIDKKFTVPASLGRRDNTPKATFLGYANKRIHATISIQSSATDEDRAVLARYFNLSAPESNWLTDAKDEGSPTFGVNGRSALRDFAIIWQASGGFVAEKGTLAELNGATGLVIAYPNRLIATLHPAGYSKLFQVAPPGANKTAGYAFIPEIGLIAPAYSDAPAILDAGVSKTTVGFEAAQILVGKEVPFAARQELGKKMKSCDINVLNDKMPDVIASRYENDAFASKWYPPVKVTWVSPKLSDFDITLGTGFTFTNPSFETLLPDGKAWTYGTDFGQTAAGNFSLGPNSFARKLTDAEKAYTSPEEISVRESKNRIRILDQTGHEILNPDWGKFDSTAAEMDFWYKGIPIALVKGKVVKLDAVALYEKPPTVVESKGILKPNT